MMLENYMIKCSNFFVGRRPAPGTSRFALGIKNTYSRNDSLHLLQNVTRYFLCPFLKG